MLKKLALITLLISTPAISFSMCNPCMLTPAVPPSYVIDDPNIAGISFSSSTQCSLLAVATTAGSVIIYTVDSENCVLTPSETIGGAVAQSVEFSPDGNCLIARGSSSIDIFAVGANCMLTDLESPISVTNPEMLYFLQVGIV